MVLKRVLKRVLTDARRPDVEAWSKRDKLT